MLDKSLFISDEIHERDIELPDGKKHKMFFKELPAGEFRRYALANSLYDGDPDDDEARAKHEDAMIDSMARLVSKGLVTESGDPALTFNQAKKLKPGPMVAFFNAIQEVNSQVKKKTVTGDSGTS